MLQCVFDRVPIANPISFLFMPRLGGTSKISSSRISPLRVTGLPPPFLYRPSKTGDQKRGRHKKEKHKVGMATADKLVRDLAGIGDAASFADETERVRARDALLEALRKVQSPWDIVWDHNWVQAATYSCIKTFVDAGVFDRWAAAGGGARTSAELAELSGVEEQVVRMYISLILYNFLDSLGAWLQLSERRTDWLSVGNGCANYGGLLLKMKDKR